MGVMYWQRLTLMCLKPGIHKCVRPSQDISRHLKTFMDQGVVLRCSGRKTSHEKGAVFVFRTILQICEQLSSQDEPIEIEIAQLGKSCDQLTPRLKTPNTFMDTKLYSNCCGLTASRQNIMTGQTLPTPYTALMWRDMM